MDLISEGIKFDYEFDEPEKKTFKFRVSGVMAAHFELVHNTIEDLIKEIEHRTSTIQVGKTTCLAGPFMGKALEEIDIDDGTGQGFRNLMEVFHTIPSYGENKMYYGVSPYDALPHWRDLVNYLYMKISQGAEGGVSLVDLYNEFEATLRPYSEEKNMTRERIARIHGEVNSREEFNKIQDEIANVVLQDLKDLSLKIARDQAVFDRDEKYIIPVESLELLGKKDISEGMTIRQLYEKYDIGAVASLLIRVNPKSKHPDEELYEKLKDHLVVYLHWIYNLLPYVSFIPAMIFFWKNEPAGENWHYLIEMLPEDQAIDYVRRLENLESRMSK